MTKSELHAVMTGGFATIAGGVLAAYISFGVSIRSIHSSNSLFILICIHIITDMGIDNDNQIANFQLTVLVLKKIF
jgi:nucleoside permease NupC